MKMFKGKYLCVLIAMCCIIAGTIGILTNAAGVFFSPIANEFGVGVGSASLTLTIMNIAFACGALVISKILTEKSFKKILFVAMIVVSGVTALLAIAPNVFVLYILNAIRGFAAGVVGVVLVTIVLHNWFHANTGLVTSIAFGFSGIAGALFSPIFSSIIQSSNWRIGYLICAVIIAVLFLPSLLLPIGLTPSSVGAEPFGGEVKKENTNKVVEAQPISISLFFIVLTFAVFVAFASAMPQHFPGLAENYGLRVGALMMSVCMITNTCGKLLLGAMIDKIGNKKSCVIYLVLIILGFVLCLFMRNNFGLLLGAGLIGLSYALNTVGFVTLCLDMFGSANYGVVYPKLSLGTTISNAVGSSLIGFLYDFSGSYNDVMYFNLFIVMISVVIIFYCYRKSNPIKA